MYSKYFDEYGRPRPGVLEHADKDLKKVKSKNADRPHSKSYNINGKTVSESDIRKNYGSSYIDKIKEMETGSVSIVSIQNYATNGKIDTATAKLSDGTVKTFKF